MRFGIDRIDEELEIFKNKRVGLITSITGLSSDYRQTIDILNEKVNLTAMFSPEHGVRGNVQAGGLVEDYIDSYTGVPVYSLYRKDSKRLTEEMLSKVDTVVYDIADVGARFYTFIYTLMYALYDCEKYHKQLVVLDRPNPLGTYVQGGVLKPEYKSFVGGYELAMRYGLTCGEFAEMVKKEQGLDVDLKIIKLSDWDRNKLWCDLSRPFISPSMGIPTFETALIYSGTCLFEGTNLSEGRGTTAPFKTIGAEFINGHKLSEDMNRLNLKGVKFTPAYFTPTFSKFEAKACEGVTIHITNPYEIVPVEVALQLIYNLKLNYKEQFEFLPPVHENGRSWIELLTGSNIMLDDSLSVNDIINQFKTENKEFELRKQNYHLY